MNSFFARVEDKDSAGGECQIYDVTNEEKVVIEEWEVKGLFAHAKARKACGPDGVKPRVLKACAAQLSFIFFSHELDSVCSYYSFDLDDSGNSTHPQKTY